MLGWSFQTPLHEVSSREERSLIKIGAASGAEFAPQFGIEFGAEFGAELGGAFGAEFDPEFGAEFGAVFGTEFGAEFGVKLGAEFGRSNTIFVIKYLRNVIKDMNWLIDI